MKYYFSLLGALAVPTVAIIAAPISTDTRATARTLAESAPSPTDRATLVGEVALAYARAGQTTPAQSLAAQLPPGLRGLVLIELALRLPAAQGAEAEQLLLDAQTAKALTNDFRKARLARLLAVAYARRGKFEAATALAHTVPDTEDKAFAQRDVVAELCRAGELTRARELASAIEENRRYGTYRQKAAAYATVARMLHTRGDVEGAESLLAQAKLLLPKKPGWSDGEAYRDVALALYTCGQKDRAAALLAHAESLAQQIAGPWRVAELARGATAWRLAGEPTRADARLADAQHFLAGLTPLERADEALTLAQAYADAEQGESARTLLSAVLAEAERAPNPDTVRKIRVQTLLALAALDLKA